jgi:hypothetical protein
VAVGEGVTVCVGVADGGELGVIAAVGAAVAVAVGVAVLGGWTVGVAVAKAVAGGTVAEAVIVGAVEVAVGDGGGLKGSLGLVPLEISTASDKPSPSVSALEGLVPYSLISSPSERRSLSVWSGRVCPDHELLSITQSIAIVITRHGRRSGYRRAGNGRLT